MKLPALVEQRRRRGERVGEDSDELAPHLRALGYEGKVWSAEKPSPGPPITYPPDFFVEHPSGRLDFLERREQLSSLGLRIQSPADALRYVRLLYGPCVRTLYEEEPRYIELSPEFTYERGEYIAPGLGQRSPIARMAPDGAYFEIIRVVLPGPQVLPDEGATVALPSVLRLKEKVTAEGEYWCDASEVPLVGVSLRLVEQHYLEGRPLFIEGSLRRAGLVSATSWR